jgi:Icc-related predicted phosphoesterase
MKVLHSSDLHGNWRGLFNFSDFDVWVDSGDFFRNYTNPRFNRINPHEEVQGQTKALSIVVDEIRKWLNGRPLISVSGNHDYISLADQVSSTHQPAYELSASNSLYEFGVTWSGFREVPFIGGFWNGEIHQNEFKEIVEESFSANPSILITHAPPLGILDQGGIFYQNLGIIKLNAEFQWSNHQVKHHFFGHIHEQGGKSVEQMGVQFHNSATKIRVIQV